MRFSLWLLTLWIVFTSGSAAVFADTRDDDTLKKQSSRNTAEVQAYKRVKNAVVNLHGQKTVRETAQHVSYAPKVRRINGMGTGVIIDPRGYILTNYHVIEGIQKLVVTGADGRSNIGNLVAFDKQSDLAIIKVDTFTPFVTMNMGTSSDLSPAESVMAVGNAYGYADTASKGIISALKRTVPVSDTQIYYDLIQTDASINPGNSGGPLVNLDGQMIGVIVAVRVGAQGIGFAIPVNKAVEVAAKLLESENRKRISHGLSVTTKYVNHKAVTTINRIQSGSAAAKAGLRAGDKIVKFNTIDVHRSMDVQRALLDTQPGNQVRVVVQRSGKIHQVDLKLGKGLQDFVDLVWKRLGLKLHQEDPKVVKALSSVFSGGLRVDNVRQGSPASQSGIQKGDILVGLHLWQTSSIADLQFAVWQPVVQQKAVVFQMLRRRNAISKSVRMASNPVVGIR